MSLGEKIRELDEQVAEAVRRAVEDLRSEMRRRLDEATIDLQRRLGEVAPELPRSFVDEEHLRRIAEEAAAPTSEALDAAREEGLERGRSEAQDPARRAAQAELRAALSGIDRARSQSEILQRLLDESLPYARRAAVLLLREGRLSGWGARGFEADPAAAREVSLPAEEPPWSALVAGGGATLVPGARSASLASQLDSALPKEACLVPLVLRDRLAAIVYADRVDDGDPLELEALQTLTYVAALALETLAVREREATATLLPAEVGEASGVEAFEAPAEPAALAETGEVEELAPAGEPVGAEEPSFEAEFEMEVEELELGAEPAPGAEGLEEIEAIEEIEPLEPLPDEGEREAPAAVEPYGEEAYGEPAAPAGFEPAEGYPTEPEEPAASATPPHGDELLTRRYDYVEAVEEADARAAAATEEVDETALEETAFEEAPELEEPPPAEGAPEPLPWQTEAQETEAEEVEVEEVEVEEVEAQETEAVTAPPAAETGVEEAPPEALEETGPEAAPEAAEEDLEEEAGAVPPPPAPPHAGGAVEPPADVEGPGWAFSASREPVAKQEEAVHEEARRLARLLVSEIQLYNQDEVDEGRRNRDIYERLKDDIDRSRQLYEERVDAGVRETTDYFYQELVRQLAAGDAKALGI